MLSSTFSPALTSAVDLVSFRLVISTLLSTTFIVHFDCFPLLLVAVIIAVPKFFAVTTPSLVTVATLESLLDHVTD